MHGKIATLLNGRAAAEHARLHVSTRGSDFVDSAGRVLSLRGVNLGGSSKMPAGATGPTHVRDGFFESMRSVSFVGRPFPLVEANEHFNRMRAWGFNLIRLIITWEAVEHAGPGEYDEAYLEYLAALIERARAYGLAVYIDPHQDVWSRFSGGDGAPGWTFEKVGLDVRSFEPTGAALVHETFGGAGASDADKAKFPRMCWPTNLHKLACATMFTLFWAGDAYAPRTTVDGVPVQAYLQDHYTRAMCKVAAALRHLPNVLGFGTMNEPLPGYIGIKALDKLSGPLKNGLMPTPFEGMALGGGFPTRVGRYTLDSLRCLAAGLPVSTEVLNKGRVSAWLPGRACPWRAHGVWDIDARTGEPTLMRADYFAPRPGCDFGHDFYVPFTKQFAAAVRSAGHDDWLIFVEMPPADLGLCPFPVLDVAHLGGGIVHAPHWYDQLTLFLGKFVRWVSIDVQKGSPHFGTGSVSRLRARQLHELLQQAGTHVGGAPTLIGEVGIPFDMHDREAYAEGKRATLANCEAALRATVDALEASHLSYALWCYTADHTAEWGDGWNREDLSLFSRSAAPEVPLTLDPFGVYLGGRALAAFVRPYVQALAGTLVGTPTYDSTRQTYSLTFRHDATCEAPTILFVPTAVQYRRGFALRVSDGAYECDVQPPEAGTFVVVRYRHDPAHAVHTLLLTPSGTPPPPAPRGRASALIAGEARTSFLSAQRRSPPLPSRRSAAPAMVAVSRMRTT